MKNKKERGLGEFSCFSIILILLVISIIVVKQPILCMFVTLGIFFYIVTAKLAPVEPLEGTFFVMEIVIVTLTAQMFLS